MGINTNFYVYLGIQVDWNEEFVDLYNDLDDINDTPNTYPEVLFDGMSGSYMILGVRLFDTGDYRWDFEDYDPNQSVDPTKIPKLEQDYKKKFIDQFPNFSHLIEQPFKLFMIQHLS